MTCIYLNHCWIPPICVCSKYASLKKRHSQLLGSGEQTYRFRTNVSINASATEGMTMHASPIMILNVILLHGADEEDDTPLVP